MQSKQPPQCPSRTSPALQKHSTTVVGEGGRERNDNDDNVHANWAFREICFAALSLRGRTCIVYCAAQIINDLLKKLSASKVRSGFLGWLSLAGSGHSSKMVPKHLPHPSYVSFSRLCLDTKIGKTMAHKPIKGATQAVILHTLGVQVEQVPAGPSSNPCPLL